MLTIAWYPQLLVAPSGDYPANVSRGAPLRQLLAAEGLCQRCFAVDHLPLLNKLV